jgi:genome maintenance exonuclease 1
MKVFNHIPTSTPLEDLKAEIIDGKRYYTTPSGNIYPSVTSILSILSAEAISDWKTKVGKEQAENISQHASNRGTELHAILEAYIKNEPLTFPEDPKSKVKIMFNRLKRVLVDVDDVVAQEIALYSDTLTTAGRCDLIANYKNKLSIIDFKGATKAKKRDWILGYFLQATAYSLMYEERTGVKVDQLVILMCGENDFSCQVFIESRDKYIQTLEETIERFYNEANKAK